MAKLYNLARMSTATTGTGTIALGSAVPPFLTFAQAGVQDGETVTYSIIDGTINSEIGRGIYTASGTTLTRAVLKSTNSNSAINLSGLAQVLVTTAAEDIITPGASQPQAEAGTDNSTVMTPLRVAQSIVTNAQPTKNIVGRNGGLEVWQRGASISVAASAVAYTADGWYLATGANQASTVSRQGGALSNGSRFSARVQRNSGQTGTGAMRICFPLEDDELARMRGKCVVLSFIVATGADWSPTSGTLSFNLYCGTGAVGKRSGTAYTSESNPITGSLNLAPSFAPAQQISSISAAVSGSIAQAELQFSWVPQGTALANDWVQIDDVQIEVVPAGISSITPSFERTTYNEDLFRCWRHAHWYAFLPATASFVTYLIPTMIVPAMRVTPSYTFNVQGTTQTFETSGGTPAKTWTSTSGGPVSPETWTNLVYAGLGPTNFTTGIPYTITNILLSADI